MSFLKYLIISGNRLLDRVNEIAINAVVKEEVILSTKYKKTVILLSTYNGQKYITTLLDSIQNQNTNSEIEIIIRDDGSTDKTCEIIECWIGRLNIKLFRGSNIRPRNSYYELVQIAPEADYYGFCDQDDMWHADKIESAISMLEGCENAPKLYFSNVHLVDQAGESLEKKRDIEVPMFELEQIFSCNPALGCTMVANVQLMRQLKRLSFEHFFMHDVAAIILAASIGQVIYDEAPRMDYRQHMESVTQGHRKIKNIKNKIDFWFFQKDITIAEQAEDVLTLFGSQVNQQKRKVLEEVSQYRTSINRFKLIHNKKYRVKSTKCNRSFIIRVLLGLA
jgi:rhamnosyltransferase